MNFDIILQLTSIIGFIGIVFFIFKKIDKVKALPASLWENSLHKFLFKIRIVFLKADNKTLELIKKLKQRSEKRKKVDDYWKEIKTSIEKKNPSKNKPA